jgi:putative aldouronate transport system permease protein
MASQSLERVHHPRSQQASWQRAAKYLKRNWPLYVMMVPALVLLALFAYYPMYGIVIAFQRYNPGIGFLGSPWVGLRNFERLFASPNFGQVMTNTLLIAVGKIISLQLAAILLALLLNEVRALVFKRAVQTVVYLPHFLSWIVLGGIVSDLLAPNGMVNQALGLVGVEPVLFLSSNTWFRPVIIVSHLWKEVGWAAIIYLAALTGIDPQLYEAAAIDGATRWQQTLHVSIPGIRTVIVVLAALSLGQVLNAGFEQVFVLYNPSVYATGDILDTYVYRQGLLASQFSLAAAAGLVGSSVSFVLIIASQWAAQRWGDYRIF